MDIDLESMIYCLTPTQEEFNSLETNTVAIANSLVMLSELEQYEEVPKLLGAIEGLLLSANIYTKIGDVIERTPTYDEELKIDALENVRNYAIYSEFSHFLLSKIYENKFEVDIPTDKSIIDITIENPKERIRVALEHGPRRLRKQLINADKTRMSDAKNKDYSFYEKPATKILINGTAVCIEHILSLPPEEIHLTEVLNSYSATFGLKLMSQMYSNLAETLKQNPDLCFLTQDSNSKESIKTSRKLSQMALTAYDLVETSVFKNFEKLIEKNEVDRELTLILLAEEIGPAYLRRLITEHSRRTSSRNPELNKILCMDYKDEDGDIVKPISEIKQYIMENKQYNFFLNRYSKQGFLENWQNNVSKKLKEVEISKHSYNNLL